MAQRSCWLARRLHHAGQCCSGTDRARVHCPLDSPTSDRYAPFPERRGHYLTFGLIYLTVVSALVLVPGQDHDALGIELLLGGFIAIAITGIPIPYLRSLLPTMLPFRARQRIDADVGGNCRLTLELVPRVGWAGSALSRTTSRPAVAGSGVIASYRSGLRSCSGRSGCGANLINEERQPQTRNRAAA